MSATATSTSKSIIVFFSEKEEVIGSSDDQIVYEEIYKPLTKYNIRWVKYRKLYQHF